MAWNNILGERGEQLAISHLKQKGYQILETNWRYHRAELDIIAMNGEVLVFLEVKTRNNNNFSEPEMAVDSKKQKLMASAGAAYMRKIEHDWEVRFDVIAIIYKNEKDFQVNHFEDAFFPYE